MSIKPAASRILRIAILLLLASIFYSKTKAQCSIELQAGSYSSGCAPHSVGFILINNSGKTVSASSPYKWNFGDGATNNTTDAPGHHYQHPGTYTVSVEVKFSDGTKCNAVLPYPIRLFEGPNSSFYCITDTIQHLSKSGVMNNFCFKTPPEISLRGRSGAPIVKYIWNFGNGDTTTKPHPCYTYDHKGIFNISLTVIDSNGCSNLAVRHQSIAVIDMSYFTYAEKNDSAYFYNESIGQNLVYEWDFGDGNKRTEKSPVYYYSKHGTYTVCLSVLDTITGDRDTFCRQVNVSQVYCNADFSKVSDYKTVFLSSTIGWGANTLFMWTFGTGDTLYGDNVKYTFPTIGKHTICLFVNKGRCESKKCEEIELGGNFTIGGVIYAGINYPSAARVFLIQFNSSDSTLNALDTLTAHGGDTITRYYFHGVSSGKYLIKAALTTSDSLYDDYLPTYHDSELIWSDAKTIHVFNSDALHTDIYMIPGTNPGGPGFIGGKVTQGANKKEGDPLENIQVTLLTDNNVPVAYTYSAADGSYSFDNLAFGYYLIFAEIPGVKAIPGRIVISEGNPEVKDVEIKVHSKTTNTFIRTLGKEMPAMKIHFYPNPVANSGTLVLNSLKPQMATIEILSITGKLIQSQDVKLMTGMQQIDINAEALPAGIYMLRIKHAGSYKYEILSIYKLNK